MPSRQDNSQELGHAPRDKSIREDRIFKHLPGELGNMNQAGRKPITPRVLSQQERSWIREIIEHNPRWADVDADLEGIRAVAECDCGTCNSVYLESVSPQNPSLAGTKGYVGRIEIITFDDFMITITLDQIEGKLYELYVNSLDLREPGDRRPSELWQEKAHIVTPM
jgi:hypothetical protein